MATGRLVRNTLPAATADSDPRDIDDDGPSAADAGPKVLRGPDPQPHNGYFTPKNKKWQVLKFQLSRFNGKYHPKSK